MKGLLIALLGMFASSYSYGQLTAEMAEVCYEWHGYKTEDDGYKLFAQSVENAGGDPDEIDPHAKPKVVVAKVKFQAAKQRYEKKTGKKFNSKNCGER